MLSLGIIFLVMMIPLASLYLSTILIYRFALLIFLSYALFSDILGGLYQTIFKIPFILGGFSFLEEPNILLLFIPSFQENLLTVPIIVYLNADTDKDNF